ncbi:uncharacterized protein B0I36DRAFT_154338 [Microdochium trichocladiopsis]|uniref:Ubiquitin-like domain-containing protein n=1 Tax=Microdochium trichocladiopsis TaxID=1682393 RepID=A0A9P8Y098_9PEZI|nr:uncharacterized protein B0I36DRAFT_154338 [Microdochium trichocladiopsis]KAH7026150.1 hypothetical protein B0I36DRAFT_154338 [Microdochium trichocladiopsis]
MTDPARDPAPGWDPLLASETQPQPRPSRSPSPVLDARSSLPQLPPAPQQLVPQASSSSFDPTEDDDPAAGAVLPARPDKGKAPLRADVGDISTAGPAGLSAVASQNTSEPLADDEVDNDPWGWSTRPRRPRKAKAASASLRPADEPRNHPSAGPRATDEPSASNTGHQTCQQESGRDLGASSGGSDGSRENNPGPSSATADTSTTGAQEDGLISSFRPLQIGDLGWEASSGRPPVKLPIRFKDALGRNFIFPWERAKTWEGMQTLINACFTHVPAVGPDVFRGRYDLSTTAPFPQNIQRVMQSTTSASTDNSQIPSATADSTGNTLQSTTASRSPGPATSPIVTVSPGAVAANGDDLASSQTTTSRDLATVLLLPEVWDMLIEPGMLVTQHMWPLSPSPTLPPPPLPPPPPIPAPGAMPMPGMHGAMPPGLGGRGVVGPGRGRGRGRGRGAGPLPGGPGPAPPLPPPPMQWGPPPMLRPGVRVIATSTRRSKTRKRRA